MSNSISASRTACAVVGGITLLLSLGIFLYGAYTSRIHEQIPWSPNAWPRLAVATTLFWLAFAALVYVRRIAAEWGLATLGAVLVVIVTNVSVPIAVALVLGSALALGDYLIFRSTMRPLHVPDAVLATAVGLALISFLLALLAPMRVNYPATYLLLLATPLWLNRKRLAVLFTPAHGFRRAAQRDRVSLFLSGIVAYFLFIVLLVVLLPEFGHDALAMHLTIPAYIRDFGFWHFDPTRQIWAVMPMGADLLYAAAYMFGGEHAARLLNFACLLLLLTLTYGAVPGRAPIWARHAALLVVVSSPLALLESSSLFIENPWALLVVSSILALLRYRETGERAYIFISAITFGGAVSSKLLALCAVPGLAAILVSAGLRHRSLALQRDVAVAAVLSLALAAPPYVTAFIKTGNPVFPFFNAIFGSPLFYTDRNFENPAFPGSIDPAILYYFTFQSDRFLEATPGAFGFTLLLLLPVALVVSVMRGNFSERLLAFTLVVFAAISIAGTAYLRYIYPVLFLSAILIGRAVVHIREISAVGGAGVLALCLATSAISFAFFPASSWWLRDFRADALWLPVARDEFLLAAAPTRKIVKYLNLFHEREGTVAFIGRYSYPAALRSESVFANWYTPGFDHAIRGVRSTRDLEAVLHDHDIAHVVLGPGTPRTLEATLGEISRLIVQYGDVRLYRVNEEVVYRTETLKDTRPAVGSSHWSAVGAPVMEAATAEVRVTNRDVLVQQAPVRGRARYHLRVRARCTAEGAEFRLQVNWLDARGRFIGTSLSARPCRSTPVSEGVVVTSPRRAAYGVVYAAANTVQPVLISEISLRGR